MAFESLDFVDHPSRDIKRDVASFTDLLGGRPRFAIEGMGTQGWKEEATFEGRQDF